MEDQNCASQLPPSSPSPDPPKHGAAENKKLAMDTTGILFYVLLIVWVGAVAWTMKVGKSNLSPVVGGFVFFETFNRILSSVVAKPGVLPRLQPKNVDIFLNTSVSLLHSTSVAIAVVCLLVHESYNAGMASMWTHEALTGDSWPWASPVIGASCGYFAYDQWDMLRRHLYKAGSPSVLAHHAVLLTCFTFALVKNSCINYLILTLICELHSIFLHLRKVSLLAGLSRKWTFLIRLEWAMNWITFFTARSIVHVAITVKLLLDSKRFVRGVELPLALSGMAGLNVLNFILGQGLYKAYLRERSGRLPGGKEAHD